MRAGVYHGPREQWWERTGTDRGYPSPSHGTANHRPPWRSQSPPAQSRFRQPSPGQSPPTAHRPPPPSDRHRDQRAARFCFLDTPPNDRLAHVSRPWEWTVGLAVRDSQRFCDAMQPHARLVAGRPPLQPLSTSSPPTPSPAQLIRGVNHNGLPCPPRWVVPAKASKAQGAFPLSLVRSGVRRVPCRWGAACRLVPEFITPLVRFAIHHCLLARCAHSPLGTRHPTCLLCLPCFRFFLLLVPDLRACLRAQTQPRDYRSNTTTTTTTTTRALLTFATFARSAICRIA